MPDEAKVLMELNRLWFVAQKLDLLSAHDLAEVVRQAVIVVKAEYGLN